MQPQEYKANTELNERVRNSHIRWIKDWGEGLARCYNCDHEYTDVEVVFVNDEFSCPGCNEPENKIYYYCAEHGAFGCPDCTK